MDSRTIHPRARLVALTTLTLLTFACQPDARSAGDDLRRPRRGPRARDAGAALPPDAGAALPTDAGMPPTSAIDASVPPSTLDAGTPPSTYDAGTPAASPDGGTAPAAWRPFGDASPWNTRIASDVRIRPDSAALVDHLRSSSVWPGLGINIHPWSVPLYEVGASVPLVTVHASISNEGVDHTFLWPVPALAEPAPESDGHLLLVDRAAGRGYDFYQARRRSDGSWDCTLCATSDLRGSGVRPPKGGPTPWYESHGSRACGFPLAAGLVTVDEIRAGRIDHALVIAYPGIRQRWFTSPASTGHPANGIVSPDRGIPCGGRVQLDPALDLDSLGLTPGARVIARALQEYGAYVGDYSGSINVYADGSPDARAAWSSGLLSSGDSSRIPLERLRVIEWGTLASDG